MLNIFLEVVCNIFMWNRTTERRIIMRLIRVHHYKLNILVNPIIFTFKFSKKYIIIFIKYYW